ncbi:unnamed protein product [Allacma fusca]|uniref:MAGE domain-containing protein n=1 Tax=Allacma fusca TaxID=39272 RepID=A0A8J2LNZ5_9HEXA|nr:unnamed protein product [Allacma fusca]
MGCRAEEGNPCQTHVSQSVIKYINRRVPHLKGEIEDASRTELQWKGVKSTRGIQNSFSQSGSQSQLNSDESPEGPKVKRPRTSQLRKGHRVLTVKGRVHVSSASSSEETPRKRRSVGGKPARKSAPVSKGRKRGGFIVVTDEENDSDEGESSEDGSQSQSQLNENSRRKNIVREVVGDEETGMPIPVLVENTLIYLLVRQNRLVPFSRVELTREAMCGQRKDFPLILMQVQKILKDTFLMELIGFEEAKSKNLEFDSYILISRLPVDVAYGPEEREIDPIRNFLALILASIYIGGTPLGADRLWAILCKMQFQEICPEEEQFEKFLRNEYVSKQYLYVREFTKTKGNQEKSTYEWGLRSLYEFSKMAMLRNVAERLRVADIKSMSYAYGDAKKQIEKFGTVGAGSYEEFESDEESDPEFQDLRNVFAQLDRVSTPKSVRT